MKFFINRKRSTRTSKNESKVLGFDLPFELLVKLFLYMDFSTIQSTTILVNKKWLLAAVYAYHINKGEFTMVNKLIPLYKSINSPILFYRLFRNTLTTAQAAENIVEKTNSVEKALGNSLKNMPSCFQDEGIIDNSFLSLYSLAYDSREAIYNSMLLLDLLAGCIISKIKCMVDTTKKIS